MLRKWMVCSLFCGWSGLLGLCISILITLSWIPRDPKLHIPQTSNWVQSRCPSVQLCLLSQKKVHWMVLLVNGLTPALCSTRPTPSLRLVQSVVCSLFSVQSYLWTLVHSAAADSSSQCADASRSVPVRAVRVRRVHGSSWPRKSVLCQCAHVF